MHWRNASEAAGTMAASVSILSTSAGPRLSPGPLQWRHYRALQVIGDLFFADPDSAAIQPVTANLALPGDLIHGRYVYPEPLGNLFGLQ